MRRASFLSFATCSLLLCQLLCAPAPAPGAQHEDAGGGVINGTVRDAGSHAAIDKAKVELQAITGGVVGLTFTGGDGGFQFNVSGDGTYTLVVDQPGYRTQSLSVEIRGVPVHGVQVDLVPVSDASTPASTSAETVSAHELTAPRKAREDMEKGKALLYEKSDYAGSLKAFEKAIREWPDYYEAYTQSGIAYMRLGDAEDSEKAFRKAMEVSHERYAEAYVGLGDLFLSGRRFADAEPVSRKATQIDAKSWKAQSQLARVLLGLHRAAEAEASANAAVALKPDNADLYLVLANAHIQLKKDRALLEDLNHYLQLAPTGSYSDQARVSRDQLLAKLGPAPESGEAPAAPQP